MTLRFEAPESPLVQPAPVSELWYTRCPVPTASGIALELGWLAHEFDRLGIRLSSLRDSDAADVRLAHFSHSLPGLFREGGNIPAIWARAAMLRRATIIAAFLGFLSSVPPFCHAS